MKFAGITFLVLASVGLFVPRQNALTPPMHNKVTMPIPGCGPHMPCPPPCGCGYLHKHVL